MSSVYKRICLSHNPPLVLDEEVARAVPPAQPEGHPDCVIGLGQYSYPLVAIWLPLPSPINGAPGQWLDAAWLLRLFRVPGGL